MRTHPDRTPDPQLLATTRRWIERAVIGLNLCPFAKLPYARGTIRYEVSRARDTKALRADMRDELLNMVDIDFSEFETTLLIHPCVLGNFSDYNDFLDEADALLVELELDGIVQVASFHPDYQFANTAADAIENFTNRSPYPMLHLLREASIERAVESSIDVDVIPGRNIETLQRLGKEGWQKLWD